MNKVNDELNNIAGLLNVCSLAIPEGAAEEIELNGMMISFCKENGKVKIEINPNEDYESNDSELKEVIAQYKQNIEELDDDIFIISVAEFEKDFDIKEFDELLKKEEFTDEEADKIMDMISCFSDIVEENLEVKIQALSELYERF